MRMKKALAACACAAVLVCGSVAATMAYLTDDDSVLNTFTVGKVDIKLDEADLSTTDEADRTEVGNAYHLIPGSTYVKDPTVTVLDGSEESYVKMTVAVSEAAALDEVFGPDGADLMAIFGGYDEAKWLPKGNVVDEDADTRTYEFWYASPVAAPEGDVELEALFETLTVPGEITKEQLASIKGMTITVNAYAIQAAGFDSAAAAWEKF